MTSEQFPEETTDVETKPSIHKRLSNLIREIDASDFLNNTTEEDIKKFEETLVEVEKNSNIYNEKPTLYSK